MDPNFMCAHMYLAQSLEQQGYLQDALAALRDRVTTLRGSNCVKAMKAHALANPRQKIRHQYLTELGRIPFQQCVPSYDIAAV